MGFAPSFCEKSLHAAITMRGAKEGEGKPSLKPVEDTSW